MPWKKLGAGSYNTSYLNDKGTKVLKIAKDSGNDYDLPERSIRLWNLINHDLYPLAYITRANILDDQGKLSRQKGWVCPYIQGRQADDDEICTAVINIFNATGRIVLDATSPKNFITMPHGKTICVDIGMAIQMEINEELQFAKQRNRRNSDTSIQAWMSLEDGYLPYFKKQMNSYPNTTKLLKALLYVTSKRPDIFDVSFLKRNQALVDALANAFDIEASAKKAQKKAHIIQEDVLPRLLNANRQQKIAQANEEESPPAYESSPEIASPDEFVQTRPNSPSSSPRRANQEESPSANESSPEIASPDNFIQTRPNSPSSSPSLSMDNPSPMEYDNEYSSNNSSPFELSSGQSSPSWSISENQEEEISHVLQQLAHERPFSADNIRESCIKFLNHYIASRGSITQQHFEPSLITSLFRDMALTAQKIDKAKQLIDSLESASTLEEMSELIQETQADGNMLRGTVTHGLESCLAKCQLAIVTAMVQQPNTRSLNRASS